MKTRSILTAMLAALMLTTIPFTSALAEETTDTTAAKKNVTVRVKGVTVNGRPITAKEKDVAKEMVKNGSKMSSKAVQLGITAITNPSKADSLGKELEKMGDEMERLGDSLESLSEDTTFFYEGEDSDEVVLTDEDFDDIVEDWGEGGFWKGLFGGSLGLFGGALGIMGGLFGILLAILVVVLLFCIFTAPIWLVALVIWLVARNSRKNGTAQTVTQTTSTGQPLNAAQGTQTAAPLASTPQGLTDENLEMWKSGIMYACVGVGLIVLFLSIGPSDFWGIGALVSCIGVAKLIIATTTKGKNKKGDATTNTADITSEDNYEK